MKYKLMNEQILHCFIYLCVNVLNAHDICVETYEFMNEQILHDSHY
jgi:hypothetical protein